MSEPQTFEEFITQKIKIIKSKRKKIFIISFLVCLITGTFISLSLTLTPESVGANERNFETVRFLSSFIMIPFIIPLLSTGINLIIRNDIKKWPLYKNAVSNRKEIIWAYFGLTNVIIAHIFTVKKYGLYLVNSKRKWSILQITKAEKEKFETRLSELFPMATIGWSDENMRKYKNNPHELMTNKDVSNNINEVNRRA